MAQLDHFYPRKKYPIFSICLYNLVPSCSACNHIKRDKIIGISPQDHSGDFSDFKISYTPISADWTSNHHDIEINFLYEGQNKEFEKKIRENIKKMEIDYAYKMHTDYVQEILKKAQIYNLETRNNLRSDFPELFDSDEEIIRIIFGNYIEDKDLLKRPLSKLTRDILKELHIVE